MLIAASIFLRTLLYFVMLALPGIAAGAFAVRRGLRNVVLVGLLELTAIGAAGYLAFWIWFLSPLAGSLFNALVRIIAAIALVHSFLRLSYLGRAVIVRLLLPLALSGATALMILASGFLYGGLENPSQTAAQRFSHFLPIDNTLPSLFAEGVRVGSVPKPLAGDWLSSDRPPLQAGFVLYQSSWPVRRGAADYTIIGALAQSLWIFAVWLLLAALRIDHRSATLAIGICVFSGFVFLNTFFVWPKLLAAAYSIACFVPFVTRSAPGGRSRKLSSFVAGALMAFAMLSHGSSAFAVLGAVITLIVFRRRIPLRSVATVLLTFACLYLPWVVYQKAYDPPGDRLLKWHLAGVDTVDPRSFTVALVTAYSSLSAKQIVWNKLANFNLLYAKFGSYWRGSADLLLHLTNRPFELDTARSLREISFFMFVPNLGLLALGPLSLLTGVRPARRTREWRAAALFWAYTAITSVIWCLLMFKPGSTFIHQGTYVTVLAAYTGSVLAFWSVSRILAAAAVCAQIFYNALLYLLFMNPPVGGASVVPKPIIVGLLLLGLLSLAGVSGLLWMNTRLSAGRQVRELFTVQNSRRCRSQHSSRCRRKR